MLDKFTMIKFRLITSESYKKKTIIDILPRVAYFFKKSKLLKFFYIKHSKYI